VGSSDFGRGFDTDVVGDDVYGGGSVLYLLPPIRFLECGLLLRRIVYGRLDRLEPLLALGLSSRPAPLILEGAFFLGRVYQ